MKRFSLITLFFLTLTLSASAFKDPDPKYSNLEFTVLDEDAKTVSVKAKSIAYYTKDSILNIPDSVTNSGDTYAVTTIAADGFKAINIKQIILPSTIKTIESAALRNITTPFTIKLNEGLEIIGDRAFCKSSGMTGTLVLPSTLQNIYSSAAFLSISIDSLIVRSIIPPTFTTNEVTYPIPNVPIVIPCHTYDAYAQAWKTYTSQLIDPCRFTDGTYAYQILKEDDSKVAVCALVNNETQSIVLPAEVINPYNKQSYEVSFIADNCFKNNSIINSVVLPNSIDSIGKFAFYSCTKITSVQLSENIESIGDKAFAHDSLIDGELVLPASLKYIGEKVFYNLLQLDTLTILSETPPTLLDNASQSYNTVFDVFYRLPESTLIQVPCNTLRTYQKHARWGFLRNRYVDPCMVLRNNFYYKATNNIEAEVIGFDTIPKGEVLFKDTVTINGKNLNVVTITDGFLANNTYITKLTLPTYCTTLGRNSFRNCTNLKKIYLNDGLQTIGDTCFMGGTFDTIVMPSTLKTIGKYSFRNNTNLRGLFLNEGLQSIGERAFTNNSALKDTIIIPSSITHIGAAAFTGCNELTHVILRGSFPPQVNADTYPVFGSASEFIVPCGYTEKYKTAGYWKTLSSNITNNCKPLILEQGEYLVRDTAVSSIAFSRTFPMNLWQELYLPFDVDSVLVLDEGVYYDINVPFDSTENAGYFYLYGLKNIDMETGSITFQEVHKLEGYTPYLILFIDKYNGYFAGKEIVFKTKLGEYTLTDNYSAPNLTSSYQLHGNKSLWEHSLADGFTLSSSYENGQYKFHFDYNENAPIHPFSWVVTPTKDIASKIMPAPRFLAGRWGNQSNGGEVTTSIQNTLNNSLTYTQSGSLLTLHTQGQPCKVYAIDGTLLLSTNGSQEEVSIELDKGMYIIYSNGHSQKVLF